MTATPRAARGDAVRRGHPLPAAGRRRHGRAGRGPLHDRLNRAEAIVDELLSTLDMSHGAIPENLEGIYVFWKKLLWEVRLERDREKLAVLIRQVANLREAWAQIAQSA